MSGKIKSIRQKLLNAILITCGSVLILTCVIYLVYDVITFRKDLIQHHSILGRIIAANSTGTLAFDSPEEAYEILASLKAQPHIISACILDEEKNLFSIYPKDAPSIKFSDKDIEKESYHYENGYLAGIQPIMLNGNRLGTLYIKSDLSAIYERYRIYGSIVLFIVVIAAVSAIIISRIMQRQITYPITELVETATHISLNKDYSMRAYKHDDDEIGQLTDAFNDMLSEIQRQNRKIKNFNQNLEQKIKVRTKELEAANKELEAFSYSVSHDLRAPLRSIDGYANILVKKYTDVVDEKGHRYLNVIKSSAIKMGQLIDDLLAFSRVGKQNVNRVLLDMNNLTASVIQELKINQYENTEININHLPGVEGDSSMIKQVMTNLISNAMKYSFKKDHPVVEIGGYSVDGKVVYYVRDNGAGFDMKYYDKLFGVFQRLHGDEEFEGIGVGLALVSRIIAKHDGEVWAEGKPGEGAVFYFSLPAVNKTLHNAN